MLQSTTTCLATPTAVDFLYTCEAQALLSDTGFSTKTIDPVSASAGNRPAVSEEEIGHIKEKLKWEAKLKEASHEQRCILHRRYEVTLRVVTICMSNSLAQAQPLHLCMCSTAFIATSMPRAKTKQMQEPRSVLLQKKNSFPQ